MAKVYDIASPAGRVLDLVADLQKQGRISGIEAQAVEDLIWHPEFPESLRQTVVVEGHPPGTDIVKRSAWPYDQRQEWGHRTRPRGWFERDQVPSYTAGGAGDVPMPRPTSTSP